MKALIACSLTLLGLTLATTASAQQAPARKAPEPVRFHARLGLGPNVGYTETYASTSYVAETRSASAEYALRYWGFGANVEFGIGFTYKGGRFGALVGVDMTPLQEVGSGAEGAGVDIDDHSIEREAWNVFGEYRLRTASWLIGGSVGRTRLLVETCCVTAEGRVSFAGGIHEAATGPTLSAWAGPEWRWSEHWAGHALFRVSLMLSDVQVLEDQDRTSVSFVSGLMLGVALN